VPLTTFQQELLALLAIGQTDARYLAGGAALHFEPNSTRYSDDLDFFHDSEERVAATFTADRDRLEASGCTVTVELSQPGFVRAIVTQGDQATRIDWAHDSAWRFMPLVCDELAGLLLHPVDLAINKVLTLAGRRSKERFSLLPTLMIGLAEESPDDLGSLELKVGGYLSEDRREGLRKVSP
jgi:hypothetical protein